MSLSVKCNDMDIELAADLGGFKPELTCSEGPEQGLYDVRLSVFADAPAQLPTLSLKWKIPSIDLHHKWNPRCYFNRGLDPAVGSANRIESKANSGMPVYSLYNLDGINACTFALSDATHNTRIGGNYGNGKTYDCLAEVFGEKIGVVADYSVVLRFDFRRIPYYQALSDVSKWWAGMDEYTPCAQSDAAQMPLLSSWYSYNLKIDPDDLEKQCELAKKMGMDTVILDDGWQTNQRDFGYQNNGDWEVAEEKLPDFAEHVKRVQAMGLKYMVWFSVPFVGVESKAYERFKGMLLPGREGARWFSLDPRYAETRKYLADTYENFLKRYDIDGFKMDFIGSIGLGKDRTDTPDDRRDCVSIGEGVCKLLDESMKRLKAIKPDLLVEFRQAYVGPAMRKFGNMFRAVDCPNSIGDNRIRTIDVRLMSGETIVHADPITWHDDDPPHSAAMQIIHALFSVPQISRKVTELTEDHSRMLAQQMSFAREHRDVLLTGELRPLQPHMLYPVVVARNERKLLAAFYAGMPLRLDEEVPEQLILVNGSYEKELLIDFSYPLENVHMTVTSCTGEVVLDTEVNLKDGLQKFEVPPAASAVLSRKSI